MRPVAGNLPAACRQAARSDDKEKEEGSEIRKKTATRMAENPEAGLLFKSGEQSMLIIRDLHWGKANAS